MKTILGLFFLIGLCACKTSSGDGSKLKTTVNSKPGSPLPEASQLLWDSYLASLEGLSLQDGCAPIQLNPRGPSKGLVLIYHGFTGCPIQFINMGRELAEMGYHVLLPLLPGNGREPVIDRDRIVKLEAERGKPKAEIIADGNVPEIVKDDFSGIPQNVEEYYQYSRQMTLIAQSFPGERIIAGLSLGGGLSVATLIAGAEMSSPGEINVWSRGLFITPFFRAPSIQGNIAPIVGSSVPGFGFGFGVGCEAGQLSPGYAKRIGICDFAIGNISTLQALGAQVGRREQMEKIKIPVQVIGVANDNTSDNTAIINAFSFLDPKQTEICFYPDEVAHAIFFDGDFVPLNSGYEASLRTAQSINEVPRFSRFWARFIQDRSLDFISKGFDSMGGPFKIDAQPSTEKNNKAKRCELPIDIGKIFQANRSLCERGQALPQYCQDLGRIIDFTCSRQATDRLPNDSILKSFCREL